MTCQSVLIWAGLLHYSSHELMKDKKYIPDQEQDLEIIALASILGLRIYVSIQGLPVEM